MPLWRRWVQKIPILLSQQRSSGRTGFQRRLHSAHRQFLGVLVLTVVVVVTLELFFKPNKLALQGTSSRPRSIKHTYYYTAEVEDVRRLGNVMFTFASLVGVALHNNATPVIPNDVRLVNIFQVTVQQTTDMQNTMGGRMLSYEEFGRRGGAYDISTLYLHEKKMNVKLLGYLQSFKYFERFSDVIRDNFRFKEDITTVVADFFEEKVDSLAVTVGVHIRRGDMTEAYYKQYGYQTAPIDYFLKAMQFFRSRFKKVIFVVCSDDIAWAKENLANESHLVFSTGHSNAIDLAILSHCQHVILSVGSFGWWAAWLANGTSVYYAKWPRPSTQLEYQVEKRDYFPSHWIAMS